MASKFLSWFPKSMSIYTSTIPINRKDTIAYLSDSSGGLKAYSYVGIKIKRDNMNEEIYVEIRDQITGLLSDIKDPTTSDNPVEWAIKREELYKREYLSKYPDVLFNLRDDFGVGWEVNKSTFGKSHPHKLLSGNHMQETAVFLMYDYNNVNISKNITLMDIAPTVLDLLGMKEEFWFDGRSIFGFDGRG